MPNNDRAEELAREITSRLVADWGYQAPGAANWADGVAPEDKWLAALLRPRMAERWIPVSEKWPELNGEGESDLVLGMTATGTPKIVYASSSPWGWYEYWGDKRIANPTHWRPLPSAPDTEEKV